MTVSEIRQILESPYDRKVWKGFLQTQFTNNKLNAYGVSSGLYGRAGMPRLRIEVPGRGTVYGFSCAPS